MPPPTFSVIIACRNPGQKIKDALKSVILQREVSFEVVVVDGDSHDGTAAWLAEQPSPNIVVVSEPDHGAYEAMNKGAKLARGSWLLFLGADDRLADSSVLAKVQGAIGKTNEGVFCGEAEYTDGRIWAAPWQPNPCYRNFLHHQATFYHRSLFERFHFDEALRIQADYDLNLRLWFAGVRPKPLPICIAVCQVGGLSDGGHWANYREEIIVRHRFFAFWRCPLWDAGSIVRYLRKKMVRRAARARPE